MTRLRNSSRGNSLPGHCVIFSSTTRWVLTRSTGISHSRINARVSSVSAVIIASGTARFRSEATGLEGTIDPAGDREVAVVALDDHQGPDPQVLKIDVEGGEADVLTGAAGMIARARPTIFLELHPGADEDRCRSSLEGWGYRLRPLGDDRRFLAVHGE